VVWVTRSATEILAVPVAYSIVSPVIRLMTVRTPPRPSQSEFTAFVRRTEPKLLQALVATYGAVDGREATVDALSWAWEHWDRLEGVSNQVGYLYRVGQTATRRFAAGRLPLIRQLRADDRLPEVDPGLVPALGRLSPQQRAVVMLVCAFDWSQVDVAELLEVSTSTVREHLNRALGRLREELEVGDAHWR
jgi:DNA-directed RNA polymerase specialized sigma24 family protein